MNSSTADIPDVADMACMLQALSDPVRLEIIRQLADSEDELTCGELALPVGKSTCSHHLKALASAGLIAEREEGVRKYLRLRRAEITRRYPGLLESVLTAIGV